MPSLAIASPCFNEEASLASYFERVELVRESLKSRGWGVSLLLIDDGSADSSLERLEAHAKNFPRVKVVRHLRNLGYGAAIKTALALADADWLAFVDCDSNYDQRLILRLVEKAGADVDLLNVSILAPGGSAGYARARLLLSSAATLIYHLALPRLTSGIYTMTCGFRLYRVSRIAELFPHEDDFTCAAEIMIRARQAGLRVLEFPASNSRREHGVSKMRFVRVCLGHLRLALNASMGRLGPPADPRRHLRRIGLESSGAA